MLIGFLTGRVGFLNPTGFGFGNKKKNPIGFLIGFRVHMIRTKPDPFTSLFVKKMQLLVIPRPMPYGLHQLNLKDVLHVREQVRVLISIGEYRNTVLCDVTPIDTTHVLLGRPWQYNRQVIYDGYRNTYTIQKNRWVFMLLSMTLAEAQQERFVPAKANS